MLTRSHTTAPTGREALRSIRVKAILATLLAESPLARTDLATLTGYSASTVTGIIRDLTAAGYVDEVGHTESTGGRRRTLIEFNKSSVTIAVVGVRGAKVWAALIDLNADQLDHVEQDFDPTEAVASAARTVAELCRKAATQPSRVVLAVPGVVSSDGSVSLAPAFGTAPHLRLADALSELVRIPVTVENDVNLMALGEHTAGAGTGVEDLVLISIGEGVGATIVVDGKVLYGSSRSAGEIGFLPQNFEPGDHGDRGEFERQWSTPGICDSARRAGLDLALESPIAELSGSTEPRARTLMADVVRAWAYAAITCVCVINPARVVFSGDAIELSESARVALREQVLAAAPSPTDVVYATLGDASILHGAVARVLETSTALLTQLPE